MYERRFQLKLKPFGVTPDPRFLFMSEGHREALASLTYGIREFRGLISLVGEAGTGKSTLLRALIDELDDSSKSALVSHTTLNRDEVLQMILLSLRLGKPGMNRVEALYALEDFVTAELSIGREPPVIIIDEAHNLPVQALEEIRLLTNLEIAQRKLLQVVLAGQPEMDETLARPDMRQLRQRIVVRARLRPLNLDETVRYIRRRLEVAGRTLPNPFSPAACEAVWRASGGIPRVINMLCEQSLVNAYGTHRETVDRRLVLEAISDAGLSTKPPGRPDHELDEDNVVAQSVEVHHAVAGPWLEPGTRDRRAVANDRSASLKLGALDRPTGEGNI